MHTLNFIFTLAPKGFNSFDMRFKISTLIVLIALLSNANISAQNQVYPVQVTGSLIPPHSLDLKVYGTDRNMDLSFNALLKDPTQAFQV